MVALRKESMDRNRVQEQKVYHWESVDRNRRHEDGTLRLDSRSPQGERG